jgi:RES domain-containing protein
MIVYRIEREKYLGTTLHGMGASMSKGYRWNSFNTKLVYTAQSRALATLEVAVHLDLSDDLPLDRFYVEIEIPDNITILEVKIEDLLDDWNAKPPTTTTQTIGDDFVFYNEAAVLRVPSSIVPQEFNYLINPNHNDTRKIKIISINNMSFDSRFKSNKSILI